MDTVEDIISVMRQILEANTPPAPSNVKLHCVHCALKTLSGPGQELNVDDDVFVSMLCTLILECSAQITEKEWHIVLECLELVLVKKRESRLTVVKNIVKCCYVVLPHLNSNAICTTLALLHTVLLRYPQAKTSLCASTTVVLQSVNSGVGSKNSSGGAASRQLVIVEDVVADLAMAALRKEQTQGSEGVQASSVDGGHNMAGVDGDGSWVMHLLKCHVDHKVRTTATQVTSKDIVPIPYRPRDVFDDRMFHLDESFKRAPAKLPTGPSSSGSKSAAVRPAGKSSSEPSSNLGKRKQNSQKMSKK
jgi:hypothetical protein